MVIQIRDKNGGDDDVDDNHHDDDNNDDYEVYNEVMKGDDPVGTPMSKGTSASRGGWEPRPQKSGFAYSLPKQDQLQELHLTQTRFRD